MTTTLAHRYSLHLAPLPARRTPAPVHERQRDRRDRLGLALSELFTHRDDLVGVSAVADVLAEDLLWSV